MFIYCAICVDNVLSAQYIEHVYAVKSGHLTQTKTAPEGAIKATVKR